MKNARIASLADLDAFARTFAASLKGGAVVGLVGDLGAGKTALTQRIAKALGVKGAVKSPTFILMQVFDTGAAAQKRGIDRLCHVDAYRLKDHAELASIGFEDFAGGPRTVCIVEWADRVPEIHQNPGYTELTFMFGKGEERVIKAGT